MKQGEEGVGSFKTEENIGDSQVNDFSGKYGLKMSNDVTHLRMKRMNLGTQVHPVMKYSQVTLGWLEVNVEC